MNEHERGGPACPWCAHPLEQSACGFPSACGNCLSVWDIPEGRDNEPQPVPGVPDLRRVAHTEPQARPVLKGLYGSIRSLSVIPEVPGRVIALVHDPLSDVLDVVNLIRDDAVLTMGVLRLANSVAYAARDNTQDLKMACARIGLKGVGKIMWNAMNASFYRKGPRPFRAWLNRLWKHCAAAAECAEMLARAVNFADDHLAYVGALLHDAGKVVLLQSVCSVPDRSPSAFGEIHLDTESLLRKYHPVVGLHAVQYMKAAPEVRATTLYHHAPQLAADSPLAQLVLIVACANELATEAGYGAYNAEVSTYAEGPDRPLLAELGLKQEAVQKIRDAVPERLESILSTFSVG